MAASKGETGTYHVTAVRNGGLYGHPESTCDPAGCAGNELYLGDAVESVEVGHVYEIDAAGQVVAEVS